MGRGFVGPQGAGMGWESILHHAGQGGDGARQNHAGRERRSHPLAPPRPIAIPSPTLEFIYLFYLRNTHTHIYIWGRGWDKGIYSHANTKTVCIEFIVWLIFSKYNFQKTISFFPDLEQDFENSFFFFFFFFFWESDFENS